MTLGPLERKGEGEGRKGRGRTGEKGRRKERKAGNKGEKEREGEGEEERKRGHVVGGCYATNLSLPTSTNVHLFQTKQ